MIGKLLNSLPFRKKHKAAPADNMDDADSDLDASPELSEEDVPFHELPIEVQWQKLPKHPRSRRKWPSKFLIATLTITPFVAVSIAMIPVLDPETGWRLLHMGGPEAVVTVPGTERELQEEIARGVRDIEERNRVEQEAASAQATPNATDPSQSAENVTRQLDGISDLIGNGGQTDNVEGSDQPTPEELAALIEQEGSIDDPIEPDPLRPAPLPGLDEEGSFGRIPRIADDGTTPFEAYKRPFETTENQPYVAIILTGIGLNDARTEAAINDLPLNISLALSPYADDLPTVAANARAMGHEVFLELPMEPIDFPLSDPGPRALLTSLSEGENLVRLEWLLARFPGYAGVISHMGSKFGSLDSAIRPVIEIVARSGLMFVDGSRANTKSHGAQLAANAGTPNAIGNIIIDEIPSRRSIDSRLTDLVKQAKQNGVAVGIAQSYPVTIQRLKNWAFRLRRQGVVLAPVSAIADRQITPQSTAEAEAARAQAQQQEQAQKAEQDKDTTKADEDRQPVETIEN